MSFLIADIFKVLPRIQMLKRIRNIGCCRLVTLRRGVSKLGDKLRLGGRPPSLPRVKLVGNSRRDKISQIGIEVGGKSAFFTQVKKSIHSTFWKDLCVLILNICLIIKVLRIVYLEQRNVVSGFPSSCVSSGCFLRGCIITFVTLILYRGQ